MPAALVDAAKTRDQALRCTMHREAEPSANVMRAEVSATVESAGDSVQTRAPAEDADKDADLGQAEESTREAVERENADVADAIVRSKADAPQWLTPDGVVLLRLTRHAKAVEVATALTSMRRAVRSSRSGLEALGSLYLARGSNFTKLV